MSDLRHRLRTTNKRCNNPRERHNGDGTVTVDSASWIATRELVQMVPEIDNALWELEELRKEQAKWVKIPRLEE